MVTYIFYYIKILYSCTYYPPKFKEKIKKFVGRKKDIAESVRKTVTPTCKL